MFDPERKEKDVVAELRRWAALKVGDPMPNNGWGPPLTALHFEAADELEKLRDQVANMRSILDRSVFRRSGESN